MMWGSAWALIILPSAFKALMVLLPIKESLDAIKYSDTIKLSREASDRLKET